MRIKSERVTSLDFHPEMPWLLSSLYRLGSLNIFNYKTQVIVKSFKVPKCTVRSSKFIARKKWVVAGSDDMHIRVYSYKIKNSIKEFKAHTDCIRCVAVHPTLPYVLSASDDELIKLWNWENNWNCEQIFKGHSDYVMHVSFNPNDPKTFASSSRDETIKFWNLESPDPNFALDSEGVNCVDCFTGGDRSYLIAGYDDHTAKVWDYQTKSCVQTLEGHTNKVSAVFSHPELRAIITGSEDGTVRIWDATTYRLENTLNYGLERVWAVAYMRESHRVAIGYDEGTIIIEIGRELPVASMDSSGTIIWAKHKEIQTANIKSVGADIKVADGERLPLAGKKLASCGFNPQSLQHHPDGKSAVVCGDGKYIISTAQNWSNQIESGLNFVWSSDGEYAVRESESRIKIFTKAFQEKKTIKPPLSAERIFGGTLLAVCSNDSICFYDWEECRLINKIGYCVKNLYWAGKGDLVAIVCDTSFYILKYNRVISSSYLDSGKPVDEEGAFKLLTETNEQVCTGIWFEDCFIYNNSSWRLNYYIGGEVTTIFHLEGATYLLGYLSSQSRVYLIDKEFNVMGYTLHLSLIKYKTLVIHGDVEQAKEILPSIPKEHHNSVAHFLESRGILKNALEVATDPTYRSHLTNRLERLDVAKVDGECPGDDPEHLGEKEENAMSSAQDEEPIRIGLFSNKIMLKHYPSESEVDEVEIPARYNAILKKLKDEGSIDRCKNIIGIPAEKKEILLVHEDSYVDELHNVIFQQKPLPTTYTSIYTCKGSWEAACLAAGNVIQACRMVMNKQLKSAVAVVRPPGHHAESSIACGFCLFNNVAIAARVLLDRSPVLKILIVDWDIHHGNGTQKAFLDEDRVLYFSVHRNDLFPCRGKVGKVYKEEAGCDRVGGDKARGFNINVSLPKGNYSDVDYMKIWDEVLIPVTQEFSPDIIIISGGFDAAIDDPLGGCSVTPYGFYSMTKKLMPFANGKIVLALEGGYDLVSTPDCLYACLHALLGDPYKQIQHNVHYRPSESQLKPQTSKVILEVQKQLQFKWKDLKVIEVISEHMEQLKGRGDAVTGEVNFMQEEDVRLETTRARLTNVLKRHEDLKERLSRDSDKMIYERLQKEFEAALAAQTEEVYLDGEQWNDGLLATIRERVHMEADRKAMSGDMGVLPDHHFHGKSTYRVGDKVICCLEGARIGIQYETSFADESRELYHCVLESRSFLEKMTVAEHTVPFFLPVREAENDLLSSNAMRFIDYVGELVQAYVDRREQVNLIKELYGHQIGELYHSLPYHVIEFVLNVYDCKVTLSLRYADLVSILPTRTRVLAWPVHSSRRNTTNTSNRNVTGMPLVQAVPTHLTYAEDALRNMTLPQAYAEIILKLPQALGGMFQHLSPISSS